MNPCSFSLLLRLQLIVRVALMGGRLAAGWLVGWLLLLFCLSIDPYTPLLMRTPASPSCQLFPQQQWRQELSSSPLLTPLSSSAPNAAIMRMSTLSVRCCCCWGGGGWTEDNVILWCCGWVDEWIVVKGWVDKGYYFVTNERVAVWIMMSKRRRTHSHREVKKKRSRRRSIKYTNSSSDWMMVRINRWT